MATALAAVVLVHGSGPQDRDETIGANKPFLDIARGLAAQGIAVLRYEKRTKARPQDFTGGAFGIDDETTDDAVMVDALRKTARHRPEPRVRARPQPGRDDGAADRREVRPCRRLRSCSPRPRPLLDIVIEQNRRLAVLDDGKTSDAERAAIDALVEQVRRPATRTPIRRPGPC